MPNRDNAPVLDLVLDRFATHTHYPDFELIVVDDGSTDGSLEILRRWHDSKRLPEFQLIEHEHGPGGVVDALNTGLGEATGDLVVQLDADASVETPGWLEKMVALFHTDTRVGVVTAKVVYDSGDLQACGIGMIDPQGWHERKGEGPRDPGQRVHENEWPGSAQIAEVDAGLGVCMMYRREAALGVGGYDRGFAPVWMDDVDLTISLRREGLKVFCLPQVRAVHHVAPRARPDDAPTPTRGARGAAVGLRRAVGRVLPAHLRLRIGRALRLNRPREIRDRVAHHGRYWQQKWGWDPWDPDMKAIHERWGQTEICWRGNPEMRRAGEEIISAYEALQRIAR